MATTELSVRLKSAVKTSAEWTSLNPVLLKGEVAYTSDNGYRYKVGDGSSKWSALPYNTMTSYGVATSSSLGLVKSGTDITIDSSGNVSVNDDSHNHVISNVDGLQSALDGKAPSSHGTHVSYSTTAPVMDGTASAGTAGTVARSDHKHPVDTSRAAKVDLDSHTGNTTSHITSDERTKWNAAKTHADSAHAPSNAQANQNAFSYVKVGDTSVAADNTTDTLTLAGSNVTITPDATNDKITFSVANGTTGAKGIVQLTDSTSSTSTSTAATPNSVKSAYDLANTAKTAAATAQSTADSKANASHTHDDRYYTESEINTKLSGKSDTSHTHNLSTMINTLSVGDSTPQDGDYYISQFAGGGTTTTTYHRRPMSALLAYIKGKLAKVATSGSYNDLTNKPTIPTVGNGTVTITQNGTSKGTFTMNQSGNTTIALTDTNTDTNTTYSAGRGLALSGTTFKLQDTCTTVTDWNSATTTGWYMGSSASNAPVSSVWLFGEVIAHNTNYVRQILYRFASDNNLSGTNCDKYERVKYNGTWGSWLNTSVRLAVPSNAKFTDTNTWRGIQDNLTSSSTSDSLSANQGRLLANGSARDNTKLPMSGGTMTGNITFTAIGDTGTSKGIYWSGSTDGASIYYRTDAADAGRLVLNLTDDSNTRIDFALNGTTKSYIDANGNFSGNAASATSATALTTSAGSSTQPVYFSGGKPVACTYTLGKSVPSNAVFTDTNTWRGIQNNLTSDSTTDSLSAAQGKALANGSARDNTKLSLSGGTMTGRIVRSAGGNWIKDRDNVVVFNSSTASYNPVVGQKTKSGAWTIGNFSNNEYLAFCYTTDTNYNAGTNSATAVYLPAQAGTIITSATIGSQSVNYANSAAKLTLAQGTTDTARYIIFQDGNNSTSALTACYDTDFKYNPVANILYTPKIVTTTPMSISTGKVSGFSTGQMGIFGNGIAISNPGTVNDQGWIRMLGTGESDSVLEIATGDDGGAGEQIVVRQYTTSNAIARQATLLDTAGKTTFPVSVTAPTINGTALNLSSKYTSTYSGLNTLTGSGAVDIGFKVANSEGSSVSFQVGAGKINHGVYSNTLDKWIVYADSSKVYLNGTAATLGRNGSTSTPMTFNWSGQSGQPSWLWGGNDGSNMYVYNPSNFNVASAAKLTTARTISLGGLSSGSASFNGTGNITIENWGYGTEKYVTYGTTDKPYFRIAYTEVSGNHTDKSMIIAVDSGYCDGGYGILKICFKSNNISTAGNSYCEITWLVRKGFKADQIFAKGYAPAGGTQYVDLYFKATGTYNAITVTVLSAGGRGSRLRAWTFEKGDARAAADIRTYSYTTNGSDAGVVGYANRIYDSNNGSTINITYSKSAQSSTSWLASWNGYELGAISPSKLSVNYATSAGSASKLSTARTISLTGSVTGSASFDGSGNISISTSTNHTHNYAGSSSAGGDANNALKLSGYSANSGTTANTIALRNSSGHLFATYLNQSSGAETPTTSSYIMYANSDGYLRKSSLANIKTILGLGSAAYTASSAYATAGHTHNTLTINGQTYNGGSAVTISTLGVSYGGTGKTSFTSGEALIGNGTGAIVTRAITNMTSQSYIAYNTNLMTTNTLAYWNGAYASGGNSNLAYCNKGAFGTAATKDTSYFATAGHNHNGTYAASSHTHNYAGSSSAGGAANSAVYATNIRITDTNPTSSTTYYPLWVAGKSANTNYPVRANDGFRSTVLQGTADANGYSTIMLGNNIASGTAGNKYGILRLYSTSTGYGRLRQATTTEAPVHYLPTVGGTLLNSNNYLDYFGYGLRQIKDDNMYTAFSDKVLLICNAYTSSSKPVVQFCASTTATSASAQCILGGTSERWTHIYLTNSPNVSSDERIKENFHSFNDMEKAYMEFEPVLYNFKNVDELDNHDRSHGGFKAQQIEQVLNKHGFSSKDYGFLCKDAVKRDKSDNPYEKYGIEDYFYSLKYEEMIPFNTHMIQKTIKQFEAQNEIIKQLEKQIKELQSVIGQIA